MAKKHLCYTLARSAPSSAAAATTEVETATSASTSGNKIFYTGGELAQTEVLKFAGESGYKIIDNTVAGRGLTWLTNKTSYTFTRPLWNGASYFYAMGTKNAYVFMNLSKVSSESIFFRTELPKLESVGAALNYKIVR